MTGKTGDKCKYWTYLPESILLKIFSLLNVRHVPILSCVCKAWARVANDDLLWKQFFFKDFQILETVPLKSGATSWRKEYKRLVEGAPLVETEVICEHSHQVLHVSFSHDGELFATSSKDGFIVVWASTYPADVRYHKDMKIYSWKYTQFSQFNSSDTLLLVSGVHFGSSTSTSGEIAVFNLEKGFQLQCRVPNKPYDIFGAWYNDNYLLYGDFRWFAQMVSASLIWLSKAHQESESEHSSILSLLYRLYNRNASCVRTLMVSNCLTCENPGDSAELQKESAESADTQMQSDQHQQGNPPSHRALHHLAVSKYEGVSRELSSQEAYRCPIVFTEEYWKDYKEKRDKISPSFKGSTDKSSSTSPKIHSQMSLAEDRDKYLIFTTGSKTFAPHQIGIKRIKKFKIPTKLDPGPGLKERLQQRREKRELQNQGLLHEPNWLDYDAVAKNFDKVDHVIELHGHIIGMALSLDHRYLFVNNRPWPANYTIVAPLQPPAIAQEIDIHIIDLTTFKEVGSMCRSKRAFTPCDKCFFIFLDVSHLYVASGAEDRHGYIWDHHYGMCLARLSHGDVVNSVAFNPKDPEMLVTVSDDHKIKVWRSRRRARQLGINISQLNIAKELRVKHRIPESSPT